MSRTYKHQATYDYLQEMKRSRSVVDLNLVTGKLLAYDEIFNANFFDEEIDITDVAFFERIIELFKEEYNKQAEYIESLVKKLKS